MTDAELKLIEGDLKGRIAETLVELLLKKSGNRVQRHGHEWRAARLETQGKLTEKDRCAPDLQLTLQNGRTEYVEVKYRAKATLHAKDKRRLNLLSQHWQSKIVLVHSVGLGCPFMVIPPPYYEGENLIIHHIDEEEDWGIQQDVLEECERLMGIYDFFKSQS